MRAPKIHPCHVPGHLIRHPKFLESQWFSVLASAYPEYMGKLTHYVVLRIAVSVQPQYLYLVQARVGVHSINDPGETYNSHTISHFVEHPLYDASNNQNDFVILFLDSPLDFNSGVGMAPICLPQQGFNHDVGTIVQISGWGQLAGDGPVSNDLMAINMTLADTTECDAADSRPVTAHNQICTNTPGMSTCYGDSGGPMTAINPNTGRMELIGIVSFGAELCDGHAVFARVSHYVDWIRSETSPLCY